MTVATEDRVLKGRRTVFPMSRVKIEEKANDDGKRRFQGYAAVFGNRDAYGDIIMKGAFERTLVERPDIKVLWQHNPDWPIGKSVAASEDEFGLFVTGEMSNTDRVTGEVVPLMLDGVVNGLSIGYDVIEEEHNSEVGAWFLKDIDLWEYSPVTFPANDLATVTGVKRLGAGEAGVHDEQVRRHAKALVHELDGFYAKSDRQDGLDFDALRTLHDLIGRRVPGLEATGAADALVVEQAYLQGGNDSLAALKAVLDQDGDLDAVKAILNKE